MDSAEEGWQGMDFVMSLWVGPRGGGNCICMGETRWKERDVVRVAMWDECVKGPSSESLSFQ